MFEKPRLNNPALVKILDSLTHSESRAVINYIRHRLYDVAFDAEAHQEKLVLTDKWYVRSEKSRLNKAALVNG